MNKQEYNRKYYLKNRDRILLRHKEISMAQFLNEVKTDSKILWVNKQKRGVWINISSIPDKIFVDVWEFIESNNVIIDEKYQKFKIKQFVERRASNLQNE